MSDNKKYYWLKLKENFFDREEIVIMENMPDGYLYSNILLKLYLRSLKNEGRLMFNNRIPYNAEMLSTITRHEVGTVERAIKIFRELGIVEVLDNGAIFMSEIQEYIGKGSSEGERKRAYRARIKAEKQGSFLENNQDWDKNGTMSQNVPDKRPPEKEIEKEIEKEREIERELSSSLEKRKKDDNDDILPSPNFNLELSKYYQEEHLA